MTQTANYTEQIQDIANYASKIGWDFTEPFEVLINKWMQYSKKRHEAIINNKEKAIKILKSL